MGPSREPSELCRELAAECTRLWDPLYVKSCLTLIGPLQLPGAKVAFVPKNSKASHSSPLNRRAILLADQTPSVLALRSDLLFLISLAPLLWRDNAAWDGMALDVIWQVSLSGHSRVPLSRTAVRMPSSSLT